MERLAHGGGRPRGGAAHVTALATSPLPPAGFRRVPGRPPPPHSPLRLARSARATASLSLPAGRGAEPALPGAPSSTGAALSHRG